MTTHELKSWPDFFGPIADGTRTFDLRLNDRKYAVGDVLRFREYDDRKGTYTGREVQKLITSRLEGIGPGCIAPVRGLDRKYVILSLGAVS
jgi:hypothetical protein